MSDDELRADVLDELQAEPAARKSRIDVRAHDGTVTVAGQVSSFSEKQKIDAAVVRVAGHKAVVKSIVGAVQARPGSNLEEVELALSNFDVPSLLKPGASVHSLATGLNDMARSGKWPKLVPNDE